MNVSVGLMEARPVVELELIGRFVDSAGQSYAEGRHRLMSKVTLTPSDPSSCAFALDDMKIGIGFHWERQERQVFRGAVRVIKRGAGLTVINDVPIEEYVTSVISSEMSASCPLDLLKAHAVISRSWLLFPKDLLSAASLHSVEPEGKDTHEIVRWYGREAHPDFDVCADDHCQRYQGITKAFSDAASEAVNATRGELLLHRGRVCDARFSKCCGGVTEEYSTAWEDRDVPYLKSVCDGPAPPYSSSPEKLIRSAPAAYCNTRDSGLLRRILPGFDQETQDFYRWRVDLGPIRDLQALGRGPSGRIYRLKIEGEKDYIIIGKELEIRRALSRSHLYSSAFVVDKVGGRFVLRGAGWGHGVGLCQIGAAVMASRGKSYREILMHYYRGADVSVFGSSK
jgi:SpoIID/LytB domain protein